VGRDAVDAAVPRAPLGAPMIGMAADGEAAWSWRPMAGVKSRSMMRGDGGNNAWSPGRARRKPLKPLRREGRADSGEPVV